jgi:hypothetical protein
VRRILAGDLPALAASAPAARLKRLAQALAPMPPGKTVGEATGACWDQNVPGIRADRALSDGVTCGQQNVPRADGSCQLIEQRLGLLQIDGVKALGEPAVDLSEQLVGFGTLALLLPQPSQADRRPQLERLRLLTASGAEGLEKTGFRLTTPSCSLPHRQRSAVSGQLRTGSVARPRVSPYTRIAEGWTLIPSFPPVLATSAQLSAAMSCAQRRQTLRNAWT